MAGRRALEVLLLPVEVGHMVPVVEAAVARTALEADPGLGMDWAQHYDAVALGRVKQMAALRARVHTCSRESHSILKVVAGRVKHLVGQEEQLAWVE